MIEREIMKRFIQEFKTFALRGNVLEMAIGVIIGGAFTSIVNSLVQDVFTPIIGVLTGGIDFSALTIGLGNAQIKVGNFINAVISFLLVALCIFLFIKAINRFVKKTKEETPPPLPSREELLLAEIRDLLKERING